MQRYICVVVGAASFVLIFSCITSHQIMYAPEIEFVLVEPVPPPYPSEWEPGSKDFDALLHEYTEDDYAEEFELPVGAVLEPMHPPTPPADSSEPALELPKVVVPSILDEVIAAYNALPVGRVLFPVDGTMLQGSTQVVIVRVYAGKVPVVDIDRLNSSFGTNTTEELRISQNMCADVTSLSPGAFDVAQITERCQLVIPPRPVEWRWLITALKKGSHNLNLIITTEMMVAGYPKLHNEVSKDAIISVHVSWYYVTKRFFAQNWQWLVSSLGGLVGIFMACRKWVAHKKPRKPAGF